MSLLTEGNGSERKELKVGKTKEKHICSCLGRDKKKGNINRDWTRGDKSLAGRWIRRYSEEGYQKGIRSLFPSDLNKAGRKGGYVEQIINRK